MDASHSLDPTAGPMALVILSAALWGAAQGFHPTFVGSEGGNSTWHRPQEMATLRAGAPRNFQKQAPLGFRLLADVHGGAFKVETRATRQGHGAGGWDNASPAFHAAFTRAVERHPSGYHRAQDDGMGGTVRVFFPDPVGTFRGGRFVFHMRFHDGAPSAHHQLRWAQDLASLLESWELPRDLASKLPSGLAYA